MSGKNWSAAEINVLKQLYPATPNSVLSEEHFTNRTEDSISTKARRLGIEKRENFYFKWKIRYNTSPERNEFEDFLFGLICGEGSFIKSKNGDDFKFVFKLEMNTKNNQELFEDMKQYFNAGTLLTYSRQNKDRTIYSVQSIPVNISTICTFMERNNYPTEANKVQQYESWRDEMLNYTEETWDTECREIATEVIQNAR